MNSNTKRFKERLMAAILSICILLSGFAIKIDTEAASKKTIYVIKSVKYYKFEEYYKDKSENKKSVKDLKDSDFTYYQTDTYSYNKKGLITVKNMDTAKTTFKYKGSKLVSDKIGNQKGKYTYRKGKVSQYKQTYDGNFFLRKYTYDSKGRLKSYKETMTNFEGFGSFKYSYNKKNQVTKFSNKVFGTKKMSYNADGTLKKLIYNKEIYNYDYKKDSNGNVTVVTRTRKSENETMITKRVITYKKVSVPASYVKTINKQQKYVMGDDKDDFTFMN